MLEVAAAPLLAALGVELARAAGYGIHVLPEWESEAIVTASSPERPGIVGTDRKTVLFLSGRRPDRGRAPFVAGTEPDPNLLATGLAAAGFEVRSRPVHGFPCNPLAGFGTFHAGFDPLRALRVLLFDRRVDAVVSVGESSVAIILLLAGLLRFRPPVLLRDISGRGWRKRDRVTDFVLARVDRVLALTPEQKAWAEATRRLRGPVDMVGFAIDAAFFRPQPHPDEGYVLAVGDDAGRDYATLIAACRATTCRLILRTNSAPAIPADQRNQVSVLSRLSYPALRDLYAGAAVVAVPLRAVEYPSEITALYEAMAMGRAVVASDVASTRHAVRHGVNGLRVPAGNPAAMRAAILALLRDPDRRQLLGRAAQATIDNSLSDAAYVRRFAASLRLAIAGSEGRLLFGKKKQKLFIR